MSPPLASLLPKLREHYAEFLDPVSLVHLRLLASPTCVGLRYGHRHAPPSAFLASRLQNSRTCLATRPRHRVSACAYALTRPSTKPQLLRSCVPDGFNDVTAGPECQPAVHRLRLWGLALGSASPCADCHGAGTLGFSVRGVFTRVCAYSFRHPHFRPLQVNVSTDPSQLPERSPTPLTRSAGQASVDHLIPTILGAFTLDE